MKLGLIAVAEKLMTTEQADEVNNLQAIRDRRFGDIAVEKGYLTEAQVGSLLKKQGNIYMIFVQNLIDKGLMTLEQVDEALKSYQDQQGFTHSDMDDLVSGDVDRTVRLFLPSNTELCDKVNTALEKLQQDGTVQSIIDNYIGSEDQVGKTPYVKKDVDRSNGTLKVGTNAEFPPYEYYEDNKVTGIDMDIMQAIADELGMDMQVEDMQFDSIIAAVSSGKVDVGAAGFTVTEDRQPVRFFNRYKGKAL